MMAEMLSYLNSKSSEYILKTSNVIGYPDENFAREIMQLFSIGIVMLNMDGTPVLDNTTGNPLPTYRNSDIQTFARAWTGFTSQNPRGNIEGLYANYNRVDPLKIESQWRDFFPKMDLHGGYIGDTFPLCEDTPSHQFLRKGATYQLLGRSTLPQLHDVAGRYTGEKNLDLTSVSTSELYEVLCNSNIDPGCNFRPVIILEKNLKCHGIECSLDNARVIKVQKDPPVHYEYVRPGKLMRCYLAF
mmetsp:Transcript_1494/g.3131  ORF Transcript_1494/g.3131 Transcript_1494/m.3131 type:complete len:244 (-) Transcript_1494:3603-4334(-)